MTSKLAVILVAAACCCAQSAIDIQKLADAKSKGFPMSAGLNSNIAVDAVLLPPPIARSLFGKSIGNQYAVIELTISNRSSTAAFIIHSVFMDYSDWLLGGASLSTVASQVASVEYRIARGEALDAQSSAARNWCMRTLQFLGVVATGSEFAFREPGVLKAVGTFTGQVIPSAQTLWPDRTAGQLDRISDFGFRSNKVIPKESSDIVVAFFPLDRFITPQLKKLFLRSPAVFFVPGAALTGGRIVSPEIARVLDSISLNKIHIQIGGVWSVDMGSVPARVESVILDDPTAAWEGQHAITGIIQGAFLSDRQPFIAEAGQYGMSIAAVADASTSEQLRFTLNLSQSVAAGTILHFGVRDTKGARTAESNQIQVTVPVPHFAADTE